MNRPIIRQIKVPDSGCRERDGAQVIARVAEVVERGHVAQLDSHQPGALGGTGHTFDWSIAREVAKRHDFLLAGGLDPRERAGGYREGRPVGRRRLQRSRDRRRQGRG